MLDDLGWNEVEYHNTNLYDTPMFNWLNENAITLMNHYSFSKCIPSRAAFITGRYPENMGIHGNGWGKGNHALNCPTIGNQLQSAGYTTHLMGKWHIGFHNNESTPTRRGFDTFFGQYVNGNHMYLIENKRSEDVMWGFEDYNLLVDHVANGEHKNVFVEPNGLNFSTTLYTDRAIKIIEEAQAADTRQPWFISLWVTPPHTPLITPPGAEESCPKITEKRKKEQCQMVWDVNINIQRVLDTLIANGELENTLIVVTSDNGNMYADNNYPLRGTKQGTFDGGIRVPGWVYHHKLTTVRDVWDKMTLIDWYPTFMNIAGMQLRNHAYLNGFDMTDVIYNEDAIGSRNEILLWMNEGCITNYTNVSRPYCGGIRVGDYILISVNTNNEQITNYLNSKAKNNIWGENLGDGQGPLSCNVSAIPEDPWSPCLLDGKPCLFNVEDDPCQIYDIFDSMPEKALELLDRLGYYISFNKVLPDATKAWQNYSHHLESNRLLKIPWIGPWLKLEQSYHNEGVSACASTVSHTCICELCEPPSGSCIDACGGKSKDIDGECYCDQSCVDYNDCCGDMMKYCALLLDTTQNLTSCYDGIQNHGEEDIDCGGPCYSCTDFFTISLTITLTVGGATEDVDELVVISQLACVQALQAPDESVTTTLLFSELSVSHSTSVECIYNTTADWQAANTAEVAASATFSDDIKDGILKAATETGATITLESITVDEIDIWFTSECLNTGTHHLLYDNTRCSPAKITFEYVGKIPDLDACHDLALTAGLVVFSWSAELSKCGGSLAMEDCNSNSKDGWTTYNMTATTECTMFVVRNTGNSMSCYDGIQNQGEEDVDCGGPCYSCTTCWDYIQNGDEEGIDCGGSCAWECAINCDISDEELCEENGCVWYNDWGCRSEPCTLYTTPFLCKEYGNFHEYGCAWLDGECTLDPFCTKHGFNLTRECTECKCNIVGKEGIHIEKNTVNECAVLGWNENALFITVQPKEIPEEKYCYIHTDYEDCEEIKTTKESYVYSLKACNTVCTESNVTYLMGDNARCSLSSMEWYVEGGIPDLESCHDLALAEGLVVYSWKEVGGKCGGSLSIEDCVLSSKSGWTTYNVTTIEECISTITEAPTTKPSIAPTSNPTTFPSTQPTPLPTTQPSTTPTTRPSTAPNTQPSTQPITYPTTQPSTLPTTSPSTDQSTAPTTKPSSTPTATPSAISKAVYSVSWRSTLTVGAEDDVTEVVEIARLGCAKALGVDNQFVTATLASERRRRRHLTQSVTVDYTVTTTNETQAVDIATTAVSPTFGADLEAGISEAATEESSAVTVDSITVDAVDTDVTMIPVNCVGEWGACNVDACEEIYTITTDAMWNGTACAFATDDTRTCVDNFICIPANCAGGWGACNAGTCEETYTITTNAMWDGTACAFLANDTRTCGDTSTCGTTDCSIYTVKADCNDIGYCDWMTDYKKCTVKVVDCLALEKSDCKKATEFCVWELYYPATGKHCRYPTDCDGLEKKECKNYDALDSDLTCYWEKNDEFPFCIEDPTSCDFYITKSSCTSSVGANVEGCAWNGKLGVKCIPANTPCSSFTKKNTCSSDFGCLYNKKFNGGQCLVNDLPCSYWNEHGKSPCKKWTSLDGKCKWNKNANTCDV